MKITTIDAITSLKKDDKSFLGLKIAGEPVSQSEYDNIDTWVIGIDENGSCLYGMRPSNAPEWSQVLAEMQRLQAEYDAKQYQRDRAKEYPSFADQFDTLYHGGYDAWKAQIDAIKAKYPKP